VCACLLATETASELYAPLACRQKDGGQVNAVQRRQVRSGTSYRKQPSRKTAGKPRQRRVNLELEWEKGNGTQFARDLRRLISSRANYRKQPWAEIGNKRLKDSGIQEFRDSGIGEFRDSGTEGFGIPESPNFVLSLISLRAL